jgi:hydrogenase maturation protein HypF
LFFIRSGRVYAFGMQTAIIRQRLFLSGRVQGVGFRPFVHRLAHQYDLSGWVCNRGGEVLIEVEGPDAVIVDFRSALLDSPPPLARPRLLGNEAMDPLYRSGFHILDSQTAATSNAYLPADSFLCDACLAELFDPANRRYRYPFINCTDCGPRYSLIARLPYDRAHTAMAGFSLCPACEQEYQDPLNRRFHAEPIACPACGPQLLFERAHRHVHDSEAALAAALATLRDGGILAVKGVSAYHLMCDARNPAAIARLRKRKHRPDKPLALMFPQQGENGLAALRRDFRLDRQQAALLRSAQRPIVLCQGNSEAYAGIAPGLGEIGVMLPSSPLHHLLLDGMDSPLVATSGNTSGDPVACREDDARKQLGRIADAFLHHNRPILHRADDPLYRPIAGTMRPLRLGRGDAPLELTLPWAITVPSLALGGQMKNTVALAWGQRCVIAPHVGDLGSPRTLRLQQETATMLQHLYGVHAEQIIIDAHPGYDYQRWARETGLPLATVFHHYAHASALVGEQQGGQDSDNWLIFTWDGTGFGADGTLWGGEGLLGRPGQWRRFSRMRPIRLPGGDRAARDPWRCAAALCWEAGLEPPPGDQDTLLLHQAWQRGINAPTSSSVGRLFDALAALLGHRDTCSYEGQAAGWLENLAHEANPITPPLLPLRHHADGCLQWDWQPLLSLARDPRQSVGQRARACHQSLARCLLDQALLARHEHGIEQIGLSGGVFQNRLLCESSLDLLQQHGFGVHLHRQVPCNDAGLAWGQIIEVCHRQPMS